MSSQNVNTRRRAQSLQYTAGGNIAGRDYARTLQETQLNHGRKCSCNACEKTAKIIHKQERDWRHVQSTAIFVMGKTAIPMLWQKVVNDMESMISCMCGWTVRSASSYYSVESATGPITSSLLAVIRELEDRHAIVEVGVNRLFAVSLPKRVLETVVYIPPISVVRARQEDEKKHDRDEDVEEKQEIMQPRDEDHPDEPKVVWQQEHMTPLMLAVLALAIHNSTIISNSDLTSPSWTALMILVRKLLAMPGVDCNIASQPSGFTALQLVVRAGESELVNSLLSLRSSNGKRAPTMKKYDNGSNLLHHAVVCMMSSPQLTRFTQSILGYLLIHRNGCIAKGMSPQDTNDWGETPLDLAQRLIGVYRKAVIKNDTWRGGNREDPTLAKFWPPAELIVGHIQRLLSLAHQTDWVPRCVYRIMFAVHRFPAAVAHIIADFL